MQNRLSKTVIAVSAASFLGSAIGAGVILGASGIFSVNDRVQSIETALNSQESTGVETTQLDASMLSSAIAEGISAHFDAQRSSAREEKFAAYSLAEETVEGDTWVYGNPDARFTLYTFADTQCSFCQRFHTTPKELVAASDGLVNAQYHPMTIMNRLSEPQAVASECAGQLEGNRAFWVYLDELYTNVDSATTSQSMTDLAGAIGLDEEAFASCLRDQDVIAQVREDNRSAQNQGITGTPTSIIIDHSTGNTETVGGAQPVGAFIEVIRGMINESPSEDAPEDIG